MKFQDVDCGTARLIKATNWARSPLGPPETWPRDLRTFLYMILSSPAPKALLWGEALHTFWNDSAFDLIAGEERADRIGRPFEAILPDFHEQVQPHLRAAMAGQGRVLERVETINRRSGATAILRIASTPLLGEDRRVAGVLIDLFDITPAVRRQKQLASENDMLQTLFASAPVLIAYMQATDFRVLFANRAMSAFLGDRQLVGLSAAAAVPELADQGLIRTLERIRETGKSYNGIHVELHLRGQEEPRYASFTWQPLLDDRGQVSHILCSGYDVTETKVANDLAEQLKHELLHASRLSAMGTMAMTLAHEINQPLSASANYLAAARRWYDSEDHNRAEFVREAFLYAGDEIHRAGEIVKRTRSLVTVGAPETGPISLRECAANAIRLLEAGRDLNGLQVELEIEADQVAADHIQIEQLFVNLLRNAAEASLANGNRRALVTAKPQDEMVLVTVRDWGMGLPESAGQSLFEAFRSTKARGLGIGLSLCRTIIEAHGGQVWAENAPGGGALFSFTLPAVTK